MVYPKIDVYRPGNIFPRAEILKRISKIQKMKENLSLDEMREMLFRK